MTNLVLTMLAALGLDYVVVEGSIFGFVRGRLLRIAGDAGDKGWAQWVLDLMTCTQCFGFWSGVLIESASCLFRPPLMGNQWWISAILSGFAVSGLAVVVRKWER